MATKTNQTATLTHYIGMNGTHGCLPDSCNAYETRESAIESLADLLELSDEQTQELRDYGIVECTQEQGADYCEVTACTCISPWEHSDDRDSHNEWTEYVKVHVQTFLETLEMHEYGDWIAPEYKHKENTLYLLPYSTFGDYDNSSAVERSNAKVFGQLPFVSQQFGDYGTTWTGIDESDIDAINWDQLQELIDTCKDLADYPVIDEQAMSEIEMELQNEAWDSWARSEFRRELHKRLNPASNDDIETQIDELSDTKLAEIFYHAADKANEYWEIESGGNAYIRLEHVAAVVTLADLADESEGK